MSQFDHEKLEVYQTAIEFVALSGQIVRGLPRGRAYLADQLQRAAASIALNVAEGSGEYSTKDKARFYRIARRSATECSAVLDVCRSLGLMESSKFESGRALLIRVAMMLTRMVRSQESKATGD